MYSPDSSSLTPESTGILGAKGEQSMTNAVSETPHLQPPENSDLAPDDAKEETLEEGVERAEILLIEYFSNAFREQQLRREGARAPLAKAQP
jgi:hypothetical protein